MTSFPTEIEIGDILDSYMTDELVTDYILEKKKQLLTLKIDTCEEEFQVLIKIPSEYPKGVHEITYNDKKIEKKGSIEDVLLELLEEFDETRTAFIDQYGGETPISALPESTTPSGATVVWDIVDEIGNVLVDHSYEANVFFGNCTNLIKELDQVKFTIKPTILPKEIQKLYCIDSKTSAIFGIQFAPDYTDSSKVPNVFFKKEYFKDINPGFSEQVVNIARKFINTRWSQIQKGEKPHFPDIDIDPKLDRKKQIAHIKNVAGKNQELAISMALFYSNFKKEDACFLYMEAGGVLQDNIEDDGKSNVLLELIAYLTLRLTNLTNHCLICDGSIQVLFTQNVPTICTRFQCQFDYIEMKNCNTIPVTICPISVVSDIVENADIVDLLICMCYSSAFSDRRDKIFKPFPEMYESKSGRSYKSVEKLLQNLPSVEKMEKYCDSEKSLKTFLGDKEYELLRWILTAKRCALLKIPEKKMIAEVGTKYQYFTLVDDPEKAALFAKNRKKYGSYFAFHGSGVENWHSILRNGLINASNTDLMTSGAAYGSGVYLAEDAQTSVGYARAGSGWKKSKFGDTSYLQGMAICEVLKLPGVPTTPNPYYVVSNAAAITARVILFFPQGANLHCSGKQVTKQLNSMII
eukprot:gene9652-1856_t